MNLETTSYRHTMSGDRPALCDAPSPLNRGCARSDALPAAEQGDFFSRHGWKLLALPPLLWVVFAVVRYAVDVPFLDQWELVPFLEKSSQGQLTLGDLWAQHNEHRIFFPRMIMLGLAHLTHWNICWELVVNVLLACGIFAVLAWQIQATRKELGVEPLKWAVPACAVVVFSLCQYENWLWGWQLQMFLEVLALVSAIVLLARPQFGWGRFVAASALGIIATFSFANGILIWPLGVGMLLAVEAKRAQRFCAIVFWLVIGIACVGAYMHGYEKPVEHPPLAAFFNTPLTSAAYILKYLGSACAQYGNGGALPDDVWAVIFGIAGPATLAWSAWTIIVNRIANCRALLPYFALGAYSLASAVLTAVGRAGFSSTQALASRYCTMTAPLWVAVLALLLLTSQGKIGLCAEPAARQPTRLARWLFWGVLAFIGLSSGLSIRRVQEVSTNRANGRQVLLETARHPEAGGNHDSLFMLFPSPRKVVERYPVLMKHHLSLFRSEQAQP